MNLLKKSLLDLGYQVEEVADNVFLIEDFLKDEEALYINNIIN
jgi:hypothetical protein